MGPISFVFTSVLKGRVDYRDGRTVLAGEAACNGYNVPHAGSFGGAEPTRALVCATSLYRIPGTFRAGGEMRPGYVNGWRRQPLSFKFAGLNPG